MVAVRKAIFGSLLVLAASTPSVPKAHAVPAKSTPAEVKKVQVDAAKAHAAAKSAPSKTATTAPAHKILAANHSVAKPHSESTTSLRKSAKTSNLTGKVAFAKQASHVEVKAAAHGGSNHSQVAASAMVAAADATEAHHPHHPQRHIVDDLGAAKVSVQPNIPHVFPVSHASVHNAKRQRTPVRFEHIHVGPQNLLASKKVEPKCVCAFTGTCEPEHAIGFMECMRTSCDDEACACEDNQYINACKQLQDACMGTSLQLYCSHDKTEVAVKEGEATTTVYAPLTMGGPKKHPQKDKKTTTGAPAKAKEEKKQKIYGEDAEAASMRREFEKVHMKKAQKAKMRNAKTAKATTIATTTTTKHDPVKVLYEELEHLKEEKCKLYIANKHGLLNADDQFDYVSVEIKKDIDELGRRCKKIPEMHCEKDFQEFKLPPPPCKEDSSANSFQRRAMRLPEPKSASVTVSVCPFVLAIGLAARL